MELADELTVDDAALRAFCRRHGIRTLRLFGSAARNKLGDDSDIDLLVEFEPERTPGLLGVAKLELELQELLGREVDLRTAVTSAPTSVTRSSPPPVCCMTPPDDLVRIRHMRDAVEKALRYTHGSSRQGLEDDEILRLAITKLVEIVGEAAKQVSGPTRNAYPAVP